MDDAPETGPDHPADVVARMVEHVLGLAATWTAWDGVPRPVDDRIYTPHKALRRVADHLVDHLAELEARLAGAEPVPDGWHASATTTPVDLAPFTAEDLDEAVQRLRRLAQLWEVRLRALPDDVLDRDDGRGWTFRQLAWHVAESAFYADAVGDLSS